jgi:hypothetical protein
MTPTGNLVPEERREGSMLNAIRKQTASVNAMLKLRASNAKLK